MNDVVDIALVREGLDVGKAVVRVSCPEAGGIDLFLGTTRKEKSLVEGELVALEYQAYEEMAAVEIGRLAERARERWPVLRMVVWHRLGTVRVGEASVLIAVSCPHRGEAFACCQMMIDELKKLAPIWKREVYERGARWQIPAERNL